MIVLDIFLIFLFLASLLLIIGLFKKQYLITLLAGVLFIVVALLFVDGLQYKSGSNMVTAGAVTNITYSYTTFDNSLVKWPTVSLFLLFGAFLSIVSVLKLMAKGAGMRVDDDSEGDNVGDNYDD